MERESGTLKQNIADNIAKLRQAAGMTQLELAQKLNYSDKAVSKWERADSIPDIVVLKSIADRFGVSLDFLVEAHEDMAVVTQDLKRRAKNRLIITLLSTISVWLIAAIVYVILQSTHPELQRLWMAFIFAIPVSSIVLLVFNCIWGKRALTFLCISVLLWSLLLLIYLLTIDGNNWLIFFLGIPAELIILLSAGLKSPTPSWLHVCKKE